MAALPVLRTPADLSPPPVDQWHAAVAEALTDDGARQLADELVDAIWAARERDDFRPVQDVIEAWYATLVFIRKHGAEGAYDAFEALAASSAHEHPLTYSELKEKLGL